MPKIHEEEQNVPAGSQPIENAEGIDDNRDLDEELGTTLDNPESDKGRDDPSKKGNAEEGTPEHAEKRWKGKTAEELLGIVTNQDKMIGKQSAEVGEMRKVIDILTQQLAATSQQQQQQQQQNAQQQVPDFDSQVAVLQQEMDNGNITPAEFSANMVGLTKMYADQTVQTAIQQNSEAAARQQTEKQYLEMNPDFIDLREAGVLDRIQGEFPIHDSVSAYEFLKRLEAEKMIGDLKAELATLRQQQADSIRASSKQTDKVIKQPGAGIPSKGKPKNSKGFNETAAVDSMLAAMQGTRQ